jgi:glutaredoxin 3
METNQTLGQPTVLMYSSGWCPYCMRARALLERKGITPMEIKVDEHPQERDNMLARSGGRRTVPQIFVGDRHVGGFDDLYALEQAGELDKLLGRA